MPKSHLLKNWVPVSAVFHLTLLVPASMLAWNPHAPHPPLARPRRSAQPPGRRRKPPRPPGAASRPGFPARRKHHGPPGSPPNRPCPHRFGPFGRSPPPSGRWSSRKQTPKRDGARERPPDTREGRGGRPWRRGGSPRNGGGGPRAGPC